MRSHVAIRFDPCILQYLMSVSPRPVQQLELEQEAWELFSSRPVPSNTFDYVESRLRALVDKGVIRIYPLRDEARVAYEGYTNRFVFEPCVFHITVRRRNE